MEQVSVYTAAREVSDVSVAFRTQLFSRKPGVDLSVSIRGYGGLKTPLLLRGIRILAM